MKKQVSDNMIFFQKVESTEPMPCKICNVSSYLYDVVDFGKFCSQSDYYLYGLSGIPIYYRKCGNCGLIFTTAFDSLDREGFTDLIYNEEYLKYDPDYAEDRPKQNANFLDDFLFPIKSLVKGLDYGSGNGLTTSILNAKGWDFSACDPINNSIPVSDLFCDFNIITAFEVFEHMPFPFLGMKDLVSYAASDCLLIVGTQATDNQVEDSRLNWWYAGPRNGHVTLYSKESIRLLFGMFGFSFVSINSSLHIGVRGNVPEPILKKFAKTDAPVEKRVTGRKIIRWLMRRFFR